MSTDSYTHSSTNTQLYNMDEHTDVQNDVHLDNNNKNLQHDTTQRS